MGTHLQAVPERWSLHLTASQLSAVEVLSKTEAEYCRSQFRADGKCPHCFRPIDPDEAHDGHDEDCLYLAACDLAQMTDSE